MDESMNEDMNAQDENELEDEELFENRFNAELATISINQLNDLGNQAISLGLIAGHGHHGGQYEVIHQGKVVTLAPSEAVKFLENLIQEAG